MVEIQQYPYINLLTFSGGGDEILEWNPPPGEWNKVGKIRSRHAHRIAVVDVADVVDYCKN